jgi:hypothetical protein
MPSIGITLVTDLLPFRVRCHECSRKISLFPRRGREDAALELDYFPKSSGTGSCDAVITETVLGMRDVRLTAKSGYFSIEIDVCFVPLADNIVWSSLLEPTTGPGAERREDRRG